VADAMHGMKVGDSSEVTRSKADTAVRHIMASLKDVAFLPTISSISELISNPDARAQTFIGRQIAGFVPAIVKDTAQAIDPTVRRPTTIKENVEARIPGLTKNVPAVIGVDGKPVTRPASSVGGINPFPVTKTSTDPVNLELARLGMDTPAVPKAVKLGKKTITLTPEQQTRISEYEGAQLHDRLQKLVTRKTWQSLSDERKIAEITKMRRAITETRIARAAKMRKQ
jgi:hypothetical protein